jgi:ABC-type sugar transport system permease subunit
MQSAAAINVYRPQRSDQLWGWFFVAPFLILAGLFLVFPIGYSLLLSFHETTLVTAWADPFGTMVFVGLDNYYNLLSDVRFWWSVVAMMIYAIILIPSSILASLLLALAVNPKLPGYRALRSAFFLPHVFDVFIVGTIWLLIYNPGGLLSKLIAGFINLIGLGGPTGVETVALLDNPYTVLPSIALAMLLKGMGFGMVLFVTALNNIPDSVFEAADIDGANEFQKFWYVTIPLLKPMILFQSVTGLMGVLNAFTEFYAMTNATGGTTVELLGNTVQVARVAGFHLFRFFTEQQYGHAAAMSFLLLILALMISFVQFRFLGERK